MIDLAIHAAGLSTIPVAALLRRGGVQGPLALLIEQALLSAEEGAADALLSQAANVDDPSLLQPAAPSLEGESSLAPLLPLPVPGFLSDPIQVVVDALPASSLHGLFWQDALAASGVLLGRGGMACDALRRGDDSARVMSAAPWPLDRQARLQMSARATFRRLLEDSHLAGGAPLESALLRLLPHLPGARAIAGAALTSMPDAELLVCHGVDLEFALGAPPRLPLLRQLGQLRMLCLAGAGRLVAFVPCDPWRPQCVGIVRQALDRGFAGVTLAGSSVRGLSPAASGKDASFAGDRDESRAAGRRLHEVLQHCTAAGVPVTILLGSGPAAGCLEAAFDSASLDAECRAGSGAVLEEPTAAVVAAWTAILDHRRFASLRVALVPGGPGFSIATGREGRSPRPLVEVEDALEAVLTLTAQRPNTWCALSPALGALGPAAVAETRSEARVLLREGIVGSLRRSRGLSGRLALAGSLPQGDHALVAAGRENLPQLLAEAKAPRSFGAAIEGANALAFLSLDRLLKRCSGAFGPKELDRLSTLAGRPGRKSRPARSRATSTAVVVASAATSPPIIDCIVIGGGIAGVTAAERIARLPSGRGERCRVVLVEAGPRLGGRLHTWRDGPYGPLELGAELVHRPPIDQILGNFRLWEDLRRFELATRKIDKLSASFIHSPSWTDGSEGLRAGCEVCGDPGVKKGLAVLDRVAGWSTRGSTPDQPASALLAPATAHGVLAEEMADLLLTGTVPGRLHELSVASLAAERVKDQEMSIEEFHVSAGFDALVAALARSIDVHTGFAVNRIAWGTNGVSVTASDGRVISARTAVCTVSVGVLKSGAITFDPPLSAFKRQALSRVDMGPISKAVLIFNRPFWPPAMSILGNLDPQRRAGRSYFVPLYGADPSAPVITGLFNGDPVRRLDAAMGGLSEADSEDVLPSVVRRSVGAVLEDAAEDLRQLFGAPAAHLERWRVRSWANDALVLGGTSFVRHVPGGSSRNAAQIRWALREPTGPLFWAGEATAVFTNPWSVHGAHASGLAASMAVGEHLRPVGWS